jgi:diguanylate cyclase
VAVGPEGTEGDARDDTASLGDGSTQSDQLDRRMAALVDGWARLACRAAFIPGGPVRIRPVIVTALQQLITALTAESFDHAPGKRVGYDLVSSRISSPRALGDTLTFLGRELLPALGIEHAQASVRLNELLGELATGFAEAMRNVVRAGAEDIGRAERAAWRERQKMLDRQLQQALLFEQLTGLPNRAQLTTRLEGILAKASNGTRLGLCLVNLDRFKVVNDSLGRDAGDRLLKSVAMRLQRLADRYGYFLAHLGGDEFAVVVDGTTGFDDMAKVADLTMHTLREPFSLQGHRLSMSTSAGILERTAAGANAVELLRTTEITLGWAKAGHRGHWIAFESDRYKNELRQHALAATMPTALKNGEFTIVYQPLIRLVDRRIVGAEALARWPRQDPVSPAQFIPLAERTGLIGPLGQYLLEQACSQASDWRRRGHANFIMSVNIADAQLRVPGFAATVATTLDRAGLPAENLQLEITESALVNAEDHLEILYALAGRGVQLAVDDFGAGRSCLAQLADLPVHALKLAPEFLSGFDVDSSRRVNTAILPTLIKLGHDLALTVTAKGVETAAQAQALTAYGCDAGQGMHLGDPVTARQITRLLSNSLKRES